jgi:hypothetical protein
MKQQRSMTFRAILMEGGETVNTTTAVSKLFLTIFTQIGPCRPLRGNL